MIEKLKSLSKYSPVICFLAMEVFALIAFSLGSNFVVFGSLSLAMVIILLIFSIKELTVDGFIKSGFLIFPLVIYVLLISLGIYTNAHLGLGDFSVAEVVFIPLGLLSVGLCGYLLSLHKDFKLSTLFTVIYGALALLVFLNLLINLINFGPFYTLIYQNYYMYYGGKRSDVTVDQIAYALEGFKFIEVSVAHYTMFPILLLTSSFALFNLKFKENKAKYLSYIFFTALSVLSLIFVPTLIGLIYVILLAIIEGLILLFNKTKVSHKPFKISLYVLLGLAGCVLLIMILNNQGFAAGFHDLLTKNSFTNKVFNTNRFASAYNKNLTNILQSERFFGFYQHNLSDFVTEDAVSTNSILFDGFMTSGVIGVALLTYIFVMGFKGISKYRKIDLSTTIEKGCAISFVTIYLLFTLLCGDAQYGIFVKINHPIYTTAPFMLVLFIMIYMFCKSREKGETNEI